jgi:hypothetical protein
VKRLRKPIKRHRRPPKRIRRQKKLKRRTKKLTKRTAKKKVIKKKLVLLGVITHYYPKVNAAVIKLKKSISVGMPVLIKGKVTNLKQTVGSMQIDRKPIEKARAGQEIGLEVFKEVREGDFLYLSQ